MVAPGDAADLGDRSTSVTKSEWLDAAGKSKSKDLAEEDLEAFKEELAAAQELLYAANTYALLVILQALDAAGKDGTIKHVMSGVNPQGCDVVAFKNPPPRNSTTTSSGAVRKRSPNVDGSGSSTARTTRRSSSPASIPTLYLNSLFELGLVLLAITFIVNAVAQLMLRTLTGGGTGKT